MSMTMSFVFVGRVAKDPEVRILPSGDSVANLSIPISDKYTDKSGTEHEKTLWIRCNFWGKSADTINKYVKAGTWLWITGEPSVSAYTDKNGKPAASLEVRVSSWRFVGSKPQGNDDDDEFDDVAMGTLPF